MVFIPMQRKIISILSTNYAGSHFLSLLLGSHSHVMHIGEVRRLRRKDARRYEDRWPLCHICSGDTCPVQNGINPVTIDSAYEIIFDNFNSSSINALVDTSKKTDWFKRFLKNDQYQFKYIHLIRDPRALVRRWMMKYNSPKHISKLRLKAIRHFPIAALKLVNSQPYIIILYKWLWENQIITSFLKDNNLDYRIVPYERLAVDTETVSRELMTWLGYEFEDGQIEYWRFEHHGSQKPKYEWIKEKEVKHYVDLRWKDDLSLPIIKAIGNEKRVTDYLACLGMKLSESGLVPDTSVR